MVAPSALVIDAFAGAREAPVRAAIARAPSVAVLCAVPVARRHPEPGGVSWAGLTRAAVELAGDDRQTSRATDRAARRAWPDEGR